MKLAIISSNAGGDVDPTVANSILSHLPNQVSNPSGADAVIVPVSYQPEYAFNPKLHEIENKRIVLLDFIECGWDAGEKNNIFGTGMTQQFGHLNTESYARFDQWIAANPPAITLKRELFKRDLSSTMLPIEWPCVQTIPPPQTREEFNARPIEAFSCWGLSHPVRQRLHGYIFRDAHQHGICVVDKWQHDLHFDGRTWVTIYSPHFDRAPMPQVMNWQRRSKISVSLPGAGVKCFRSAEAPCGAIVAMMDDSLAWSSPWINGENCIRLRWGHEMYDLELATHRGDLYETYHSCQNTASKYRSERYVKEYVLPSIEAVL